MNHQNPPFLHNGIILPYELRDGIIFPFLNNELSLPEKDYGIVDKLKNTIYRCKGERA